MGVKKMACSGSCSCAEKALPDKLEPPTVETSELEFHVLSLKPPATASKIQKLESSNGRFAQYYQFPPDAKELQDLISFKDMNAQIGEIFKKCYRYGAASHSDKVREVKAILYYAEKELERLEKYSEVPL